jgi:hypothetical protein
MKYSEQKEEDDAVHDFQVRFRSLLRPVKLREFAMGSVHFILHDHHTG